MIEKKVYRSRYQYGDNGEGTEQLVEEIKTSIVSSGESVYDNIRWMSEFHYHQVALIHDIQEAFILSAFKKGAVLTSLGLREVLVTERKAYEPEPSKSLLWRFMGKDMSSRQIEESYEKMRAEQLEKREERLHLQTVVNGRIALMNEHPGELVSLYKELLNGEVESVEMTLNGETFSMQVNGIISYEEATASMLTLENLIIDCTLVYFNPICVKNQRKSE